MQTNHKQYLLFINTCVTFYSITHYLLRHFRAKDVEGSVLSVHQKHKKSKSTKLFLIIFWLLCEILMTVMGRHVDLLLSVWCKTIRKCAFRLVPQKCYFNSCFLQPPPPPPPPHHPLILPFHSWINPPLHHPLILRPSTYVAHEKWGGDGSEDEWNGEWGMKGSGGGEEESKIGKNALWLDLKVCGISFSERGELHLLQIL